MSERRSPDSAMVMTYGIAWYIVYIVSDMITVVIRETQSGALDLVYVVAMSVLKWLLIVPLAWIATAGVAGIWHLRWPNRPDPKGEQVALYLGALAVSALWFLLGLFVNTGWLDWDMGSQVYRPGIVGSLVHGAPFFVACVVATYISRVASRKRQV